MFKQLVMVDDWVIAVLLILPYIIVASKYGGLVIKLGTRGVEVNPIGIYVSERKIGRSDEIEDRFQQVSRYQDLIRGYIGKSALEQLEKAKWPRIVKEFEYVAVYPESPLERVLAIAKITGCRYFPVIEKTTGELRGIVTYSQIIKHLQKTKQVGQSVKDILTQKSRPPVRAFVFEPAKNVLDRMMEYNLTKIPIVNERNQLVGVIKLRDLRKLLR